ncbi:copper resistance protein CopD, partial [Burkholderia pseudomallei]
LHAQTHVGHACAVACRGAQLRLAVALARPFGPLPGWLHALATLVVAAGKAWLGHAADWGAFSAAVGVEPVQVAARAVCVGLVL